MRMKRFLPLLTLLLLAVTNLLAQTGTPDGALSENDAANAAGALAGMGCSCLIVLVALGIQVAIAVWVYKDAKARGMDNAVLLTILTIFTGLLGLLIYVLMRPKGNLVPCPSCQKKRLEGSAKCPHCGTP